MKASELRKLIREEVRKVLNVQKLHEGIRSSIIRKLMDSPEVPSADQRFDPKKKHPSYQPETVADTIRSAFDHAHIALDKITDSDIEEMKPSQIESKFRKQFANPHLLGILYSKRGGTNPYAKKDSDKQIPPGTIIDTVSGNAIIGDLSYFAGITSVKRAFEVADTIYVIDTTKLDPSKNTKDKQFDRYRRKYGQEPLHGIRVMKGQPGETR